jgi:VanZ family protein
MIFKIINVTLLILYCSFIYWLSSKSAIPMPMLFLHQDKLHHLGAYFMMGVLAWRCFRLFLSTPRVVGLCSVIFCSIYGISDEWHQSFVEGRTADILDWVADTVGAVIAITMIRLVLVWRNKR